MMRSVQHLLTPARRYDVIALAFVLCGWLVMAAMHLHVNDQDAGMADSAHCASCVALSLSAAPAPESWVPAIVATPVDFVAGDATTLEGRTAPSFYLCRGPPAA